MINAAAILFEAIIPSATLAALVWVAVEVRGLRRDCRGHSRADEDHPDGRR